MGDPRQRVVASGLTFERPTPTTRAEAHSDIFTSLAILVCRPLWSLRIELGLVASVFVGWMELSRFVGSVLSGVVVTLVVGLLSWWPVSRRLVSSLLHRCSVRRSWERACRYGLVVTINDRVPRPLSIRSVPAGDVLDVQMPPSMSTLPLCDAAEVIAAGLGVREVRVERDAGRADRARVSIIRCDPLASSSPLSWPQLSAARLSMWSPVPVGVDEMGEVHAVSLVERNMLTGGEPGAGKSVNVSMLVATAALDPSCELFLLDGKQVELASWSSCASAVVGPSVSDAIDLLRVL